MTGSTDPAAQAATAAEALFTSTGDTGLEPVTVLTYPAGADRLARREALRPVYEAVVARIGKPTLLGGSAGGPSVRWCTAERVLLLSGDPAHVELSVHEARTFEDEEWNTFDGTDLGRKGQPHRFGELPYTWQLDRKGPGKATSWTYNGVMVAHGWDHAVTGLELMLAAWVEQYPVQAPGDWIGFNLWTARDWRRDMIVSYSPGDQGRELAVGIHDRGAEQTEERQARMRERGWQILDEHQWWRTALPETDPDAPRRIAELTIAECRARGATGPNELRAHDISAGDDGELWLTGLGLPTHPSRGEHF
ncbi:hypothetical protein [Streptomyces caeruleatus]|uniref:Uncharacterized protein n=1 Tax=Streptomyces caeruleatus TaxID=661399 RepID=A0A101U7G7_9ACTN|nr:hypothetical protein [Streptomyces caeruleatus]KUO05637.1 hypothetical protein AQJ67_05730 [Streptomyces caeruleatus]